MDDRDVKNRSRKKYLMVPFTSTICFWEISLLVKKGRRYLCSSQCKIYMQLIKGKLHFPIFSFIENSSFQQRLHIVMNTLL